MLDWNSSSCRRFSNCKMLRVNKYLAKTLNIDFNIGF